MAAAIDQIAAGLLALQAAGVRPSSSRDAGRCIAEVEQLNRVLDSLSVDLLSEIDDARFHLADGYVSAKQMVRHYGRLSNAQAHARQQLAKMSVTLPDVMDAYRSGTIGSGHVRSIAKVHANPRVRAAMIPKQAAFVREARADHDTFEQRIQQWKRLTDQDGPTPPNQKHHEDRNARIDQDFDLAFHVVATFACQQGLQLKEVFDHYVEAETLADWEKARAEHGDAATKDHLPRTIQQRRADAMWQIFIDAAANPNSATPPDFVHNIVWDATTFEHMAAKVLGEHADPDQFDTHGQFDTPDSGEIVDNGGKHREPEVGRCFGEGPDDDEIASSLFDGIDPDEMVCRTIDGVAVEPTEAFLSALISKIRRVVVTAGSERVDLGKARLFTGAARHAVKLKATHCVWPGCRVPTSACQADHLTEHSQGGKTHPENGAPLCGKHNRLKHNGGFTIYRTPDGTWHTIRPDDTEIPNPNRYTPPLE